VTRQRPNTTRHGITVARIFLADPQQKHDAGGLVTATGIPAGTVYDLLGRWTRRGLLARSDERKGGVRVFYRLTERGQIELGRLVVASTGVTVVWHKGDQR
jgi:DNA-binding PadR family transcriptional regulator